MSLQSADFIACSGTWSLPFEYNPLHNPASNLVFFISEPLPSCSRPFLTLTPVCFSSGQHEAPATLEVGVARGVPALWSGGWWPSHPSSMPRSHDTFSIYQPYHELLLSTSCAGDMSRGEEERSHGAGLRSPATNGHHICGSSPTARRMDRSDSANSLPLTKGLTKGTPVHLHQLVQVCNPSQSSATQGSHFLHNWWKSFYSLENNQTSQSSVEFNLCWIIPKSHLPTEEC